MKFRWTRQELKEISDNELVRGIIAERMYGLKVYSPLSKRLQGLYNKYGEAVKREDYSIVKGKIV